jgi:RNA polymerase sigma-70 factor (sigma-E family)
VVISRIDESFDAFVIARSRRLLGLATLLTGDRHDGEDLLQSALLKLALNWSRAKENPDSYARQIVINLARDRGRRIKRRPEWVGEVPERAYAGHDDDTFGDSEALLPALRALPDRQRQTVVLRFIDDMSVTDTAAALGCSEGSVKSNTSKALANLRGVLTGTGISADAAREATR